MARYPAVSQPLVINGCSLRNRIFRSAHGTMLSLLSDGVIGEPLIAYHLARARGGAALSILDAGAVHPSSVGGILAYKEGMVEGWARLAERCHAEGMKVFQQLYHSGSTSGRDPFTGAPAWSPSGGGYPGAATPAVAMTGGMIDEIVDAHIEIGVRCKAGGIDGVEIHAAHGYLLHEFLSPLTNRRDDDYGGTPENRARILVRILRGLRDRLGAFYPLGVRLSGSDDLSGGLRLEEQAALAARLEREGLIDFLDVSAGTYFAPHRIIAGMHERPGYELATSVPVAAAVKVPTLVTGRFTRLEEAEAVLAAGQASMVSMVRAMIADPDLVRKSLAGREAEVRPCLGCNQECIGGVAGPRRRIGCVVNVEAGVEWRAEPQKPAASPRNILVVGGGPAGMEAARTAALRGHKVVLVESMGETGGVVATARLAPHRIDLGRIVDFQRAELGRLGVEVRTSVSATVDLARELGAEAAIVATGASADLSGQQRFHPWAVPGAASNVVMAPDEVLRLTLAAPLRALVLDDLGVYQAIGAAEHLLHQGCEVVMASSFPALGAELAASLIAQPAAERLAGWGRFTFLPLQTLTSISEGSVRLRAIGLAAEQEVAADLIVLCTAARPRQALYEALTDAGIEAHLCGDAQAASDLRGAIATGHVAGLRV